MYNPADQKFANNSMEMIKTFTPEQKSEMLLDIFPEYTKAKKVLDYLIDADSTLNKTVGGDYKINSLRKRLNDICLSIPDDNTYRIPHYSGLTITKYTDGKSYLTIAYVKNGIALYDYICYVGSAKRYANPVYVFDKIADQLDYAERNWKKKEEEKEYKEAHANELSIKNKLNCYLDVFNISVPNKFEEIDDVFDNSGVKSYRCEDSASFNGKYISWNNSPLYKRACEDPEVAEKVMKVLDSHKEALNNIINNISAELSAI